MATKRKLPEKPVNDSGPINVAAIDDMLEGIESMIPVFKAGDRVQFVHAGGKFKGSVIKVGEEGKLSVADAGGTVFKITTNDICKDGETASMLLARQGKGGKRPVYVSSNPGLKDAPEEDDDDLMGGIEIKPAAKKKAEPSKAPAKAALKKTAGTSQKDLVEGLAEKGELDYDKIAEKTGVTRSNVSQYMYRWKKRKEEEAAAKKKKK